MVGLYAYFENKNAILCTCCIPLSTSVRAGRRSVRIGSRARGALRLRGIHLPSGGGGESRAWGRQLVVLQEELIDAGGVQGRQHPAQLPGAEVGEAARLPPQVLPAEPVADLDGRAGAHLQLRGAALPHEDVEAALPQPLPGHWAELGPEGRAVAVQVELQRRHPVGDVDFRAAGPFLHLVYPENEAFGVAQGRWSRIVCDVRSGFELRGRSNVWDWLRQHPEIRTGWGSWN
ncbi:hypothetical protein CEXT_225971 [Caerostris extrusa]|uniref:Uncharacterized protein n=1 Tax=Caerostris extrusa TaxID=172846 RepID=A0AAV4XXB1_CAEEX|nr:hypothetical protein CEXT_225971 [Caerostris extrusa]